MRVLRVLALRCEEAGLLMVAEGAVTGRSLITLSRERWEKGVALASSRKYFWATLSSISCFLPLGRVTTHTTFFSFFFVTAAS